MSGRLEGKTAVITGGASGIGRAAAERFAHEGGAAVLVVDVNEDGLRETAALHPAITAERLDVTDSAEVDRIFDAFTAEHGRLDVVLNAAGVGSANTSKSEKVREALAAESEHKYDYTANISDEHFDWAMKINLYGTFYCVCAAVRNMTVTATKGSIINISSSVALMPLAAPAFYAASKAGVLGLTRATAAELADRGIRVNAIAPGLTDTPMLRSNPPELLERFTAAVPLGYISPVEEFAHTVLFLASDESAFFTGQTLSPNGGAWM